MSQQEKNVIFIALSYGCYWRHTLSLGGMTYLLYHK